MKHERFHAVWPPSRRYASPYAISLFTGSYSQESQCGKDTLKVRDVYIIQSSLAITDNYHTAS